MKPCFIDEQPNFKYSIEYKKEKICECHTLSGFEKNDIDVKSTVNSEMKDGKLIINKDQSIEYIKTMIYAIDSWIIPNKDGTIADITEDNIKRLPDDVYSAIIIGIYKHESPKILKEASKN